MSVCPMIADAVNSGSPFLLQSSILSDSNRSTSTNVKPLTRLFQAKSKAGAAYNTIKLWGTK